MTLKLNDIQRINELGKKHSLTVDAIAEQTGFSFADVNAVLAGRYVDDLNGKWKAEADITLAEYNAIRARYKPGKGHWDTEYAIARDMLIHPYIVLKIAKSQFQNEHTHPVTKPVKVKPVKAVEMRRLFTHDLDEICRLSRNMWPAKEIAEKLGVPVAAVVYALQLDKRDWRPVDILSAVHSRFGGYDAA